MPIPNPGLTLLAGPLFSRKTVLALDLAFCVALGQLWLGLPVPGAPVLYSDQELGEHAFRLRVRSAVLAHRAGPETPFTFTSFGFHPRRPQQLFLQAASLQAGFVVIDSLQPILRRSTSLFQTPLLSTLVNLQALAHSQRLSILVVLHATPRGLLRNAAALTAVCDLVLSVHHSSGVYAIRSLNTGLPPIAARIHQGRLVPAAPIPSRLNPLQAAILKHLAHHGQAPRKDLPGNLASLKKALRRLKATGFISYLSSAASYSLTPQGQAALCQADTPPPPPSQ